MRFNPEDFWGIKNDKIRVGDEVIVAEPSSAFYGKFATVLRIGSYDKDSLVHLELEDGRKIRLYLYKLKKIKG